MAILKKIRHLSGSKHPAPERVAGLKIGFSDGGVIAALPLPTAARLPR